MPQSASVIHNVALQEVIGYLEAANYEKTQETLLVFRDREGAQVTVRLQDTAVRSLAETLAHPPKKGQV